jgi:molecular chaperone GrpE (heat shock protein)
VITILATLWALVGVLGLVWFVSRRTRGPWRARPRSQPESAAPVADAEWIYGDRGGHKTRPSLREAEAILADAERKANEIVAEAERVRSRVEAELAFERADLAEKTKRLSEFLANTLEEVERASANGSPTDSTRHLEELEALHDELSGTD